MRQLVHGLYTPSADILPLYDAVCQQNGVNPQKFSWNGSPDPLDFTDDPGDVVLLDRCFGSLEQEIGVLWSWGSQQQLRSWWWQELKRDSVRLRLQGGRDYPSWSQRWIRIRRTANYAQSPATVLQRARSVPGREILAMLAVHPEVARRMNGSKEHPYLWMAGFDARMFGNDTPRIPTTWFDQHKSMLHVLALGARLAIPDHAVPEILA